MLWTTRQQPGTRAGKRKIHLSIVYKAVIQTQKHVLLSFGSDVMANAEDIPDSLHHPRHIPIMHRQEFRHFENGVFPPAFSMHSQDSNQKRNAMSGSTSTRKWVCAKENYSSRCSCQEHTWRLLWRREAREGKVLCNFVPACAHRGILRRSTVRMKACAQYMKTVAPALQQPNIAIPPYGRPRREH